MSTQEMCQARVKVKPVPRIYISQSPLEHSNAVSIQSTSLVRSRHLQVYVVTLAACHALTRLRAAGISRLRSLVPAREPHSEYPRRQIPSIASRDPKLPQRLNFVVPFPSIQQKLGEQGTQCCETRVST